jgi:hypothetical protein
MCTEREGLVLFFLTLNPKPSPAESCSIFKPGPGTEPHWGVLYPNGTCVYTVDMTGQLANS